MEQYRVEYKEWGDGGVHLPSSVLTGSAATRYKLDLSGEEPGGQYSVRVQAICGEQAGPWTAQVTISTGRRSKSTCIRCYSGVQVLLVPLDHRLSF